jgi:hypothetical protein
MCHSDDNERWTLKQFAEDLEGFENAPEVFSEED